MPDYDCPKLDREEHPFVFSASQIETAAMCLRKWAFDKIDHIRRPDTPATLLGGAVHNQIENYLKSGTPFDTKVLAGKIAMSGIQHLPPPKIPGIRIEEWFVRKYPQVPAGTLGSDYPTYWGKKDGEILTGFYGLEMPIVWDHKTCGSFQYMPDERGLQKGVQSGMYGWDAMEEASTDIAQLRWTYMRTKGARKSLPLITCITRMQAEDVMERVDGVAQQLVVLKKELSEGEAIEAPPNFSACEAYGGCAYKERCKPTAQQAMDAIMTDKTNESLLAGLRNRKNKKNKTPEEAAKVEEKKEADKANTEDKVNAPDRKTQAPPPPPEARQVGDDWYTAVWDKTDWEWKFPEEYHEAVKAEEEKKKAEEKAAKSAAKKKTTGNTRKKPAASAAAGSSDLLEALVEMIATRVVEKLKADGE